MIHRLQNADREGLLTDVERYIVTLMGGLGTHRSASRGRAPF
ncbi:MAG: hypothetical protein AB1486_32195 [Planctomycetota bacterium]